MTLWPTAKPATSVSVLAGLVDDRIRPSQHNRWRGGSHKLKHIVCPAAVTVPSSMDHAELVFPRVLWLSTVSGGHQVMGFATFSRLVS